MRWNRAPATFLVAHDASEVRRDNAALKQPSGLHDLVPDVVYCGRRMVKAANEGILVGMLCHAWKDFTDLNSRDVGLDRLVRAANFERCVGLHVPSVQLAGTTNQKQLNNVEVLVFRN